MKQNKIFLIIGVLILVVLLGKSAQFQAIMGAPSIKYIYDRDETVVKEDLYIGDDLFKIGPVSFTCTTEEEYIAPRPESSCWGTTVEFQGKKTDLIYGEAKSINDYLAASFTTDAVFDKGIVESPYVTLYDISVYNDDFLESKIIEDSTLVELNAEETVEIEVRNDLANNLEGGLVIYISHQKENNVPVIEEVPMTFKKGTNVHTLELDTSILGQMTLQVRPFVKIQGVYFYDDRLSSTIYNVLPFIEDIETTVDCSRISCPIGFDCERMYYEGKAYDICTKGKMPTVFLGTHKRINWGFVALIIILFALILVIGLKSRGRKWF